MNLTNQTPSEAFDEKWFERLHKIQDGVPARFTLYDYNSTREAFLNGTGVGPDFKYHNIEDSNFSYKLDTLEQLRSDIASCSDTIPIVKNLYFKKIDEKVMLINLVRNSALLISAENDKQKYAESFTELSNEVFGKIKPDTFYHSCTVLAERLTIAPLSIRNKEAYYRLRSIFDTVPASTINNLNIRPSIPDEGNLVTDRNEIKKRFYEAFEKLGLTQWRLVDGHKSRSNFVVKTNTKRVIIPNDTALSSRRAESVLTSRNIDALITHELTHILRYENGLSSKLKLLSVGLHAYLKGEEGVATYREQLVKGANDYSNGKSYFAAGIAMGLDRGGIPRTFREVFEIMLDFYTIYFSNEKVNAKNVAFGVCAHLFKGTDGKIPGAFLTLQCSYRDGNIAVHSLLKNNHEWLKYLLVGKFDPTNQLHTTAMIELGIIPNL